MNRLKRRLAVLSVACAALTAGMSASAAAPAHAFVCNPIDECEHVPLPYDPTGDCWVSVHAIIDYYDLSGVECVAGI